MRWCAALCLLAPGCGSVPPPATGRWHPRGIVCHRASGPLVVDGRLDEEDWRQAPVSAAFVDIEGEGKPAPAHRTTVRLLWDDAFLYVGAWLEEPHVWGTLTERDAVIFHDNDFEVFLDPDGDCHQYYELEINALGTVWDLRLVKPYKDGGPPVDSWDVEGLRAAVFVDGTLNDPTDEDRGWSVELAFPWSALAEYAGRPVPPHEGDQWRVNFSRVEWDVTVESGGYRKVPGAAEHNWVWSPQHEINMHLPERWGLVQFTSGPFGQVTFRPDPALPARHVLAAVYAAQARHLEEHGRYASRLEDLDGEETLLRLPDPPALERTAEGYRAHVDLRLPGGETQRWWIQQDARLWADAPRP